MANVCVSFLGVGAAADAIGEKPARLSVHLARNHRDLPVVSGRRLVPVGMLPTLAAELRSARRGRPSIRNADRATGQAVPA
jgi:hypothetical protein